MLTRTKLLEGLAVIPRMNLSMLLPLAPFFQEPGSTLRLKLNKLLQPWQ
jgi:hypothetical protein